MIFHQIIRFYHRIDIRLFIILKNRIITIKHFLKQRKKMHSVLYFMIEIRRLYIFRNSLHFIIKLRKALHLAEPLSIFFWELLLPSQIVVNAKPL